MKSGSASRRRTLTFSEFAAESRCPASPLDRGVGVRPPITLHEEHVANLRPTLLLLMGAVILILLIACSNVANLLLARNSSRTREIAVRSGDGRGTICLIRQFMTENLALGMFGGIIGAALAWGGCGLVAHAHPAQLTQLAAVGVDLRVPRVRVYGSVLSSLLFGTLPGVRSA